MPTRLHESGGGNQRRWARRSQGATCWEIPHARWAQLRAELNQGEAKAIALMEELGTGFLLLDERRARARAVSRVIPITGTIGILRNAKERGLIKAVSPLIEDLRLRGFRISAQLVEDVRRQEA